jgi:hypothetical protein
MKTSVVIVGRNDNYGGTLNERATACLNTMCDAFDEVIFVDWDTEEGKPPLTKVLKIDVNPERLKTIVVPPKMVQTIMGDNKPPNGFCEVIPRNIGLRRASGDYIVLANLDIIGPRRFELLYAIRKLRENELITSKRNHIDIKVVYEVYNQTKSWPSTRDYMFDYYGVASINNTRLSPFLSINKQILDTVPSEYKFGAVSLIDGCGDFQIAHRDLWYKIRGCEEDQIKRNCMDTEIQYKVIMAGGTVTASNSPPVYHIDHPRYFDADSRFHNKNELYETRNTEKWGRSDEVFETF